MYKNKCPSPSVQVSMCANIPVHGDTHLLLDFSLLQGTQSTDTLGQISQMLNLEKDQDQLFADL